MENVGKPPFVKQVTSTLPSSCYTDLNVPTYFCKLMHIYKWSLFQVNKFMITVKPIKAALSREGVGVPFKLGRVIRIAIF